MILDAIKDVISPDGPCRLCMMIVVTEMRVQQATVGGLVEQMVSSMFLQD